MCENCDLTRPRKKPRVSISSHTLPARAHAASARTIRVTAERIVRCRRKKADLVVRQHPVSIFCLSQRSILESNAKDPASTDASHAAPEQGAQRNVPRLTPPMPVKRPHRPSDDGTQKLLAYYTTEQAKAAHPDIAEFYSMPYHGGMYIMYCDLSLFSFSS